MHFPCIWACVPPTTNVGCIHPCMRVHLAAATAPKWMPIDGALQRQRRERRRGDERGEQINLFLKRISWESANYIRRSGEEAALANAARYGNACIEVECVQIQHQLRFWDKEITWLQKAFYVRYSEPCMFNFNFGGEAIKFPRTTR